MNKNDHKYKLTHVKTYNWKHIFTVERKTKIMHKGYYDTHPSSAAYPSSYYQQQGAGYYGYDNGNHHISGYGQSHSTNSNTPAAVEGTASDTSGEGAGSTDLPNESEEKMKFSNSLVDGSGYHNSCSVNGPGSENHHPPGSMDFALSSVGGAGQNFGCMPGAGMGMTLPIHHPSQHPGMVGPPPHHLAGLGGIKSEAVYPWMKDNRHPVKPKQLSPQIIEGKLIYLGVIKPLKKVYEM